MLVSRSNVLLLQTWPLSGGSEVLDFSGSKILGDAPMVFGCMALRSWDLDFIFLEPEVL